MESNSQSEKLAPDEAEGLLVSVEREKETWEAFRKARQRRMDVVAAILARHGRGPTDSINLIDRETGEVEFAATKKTEG